MFRGRIRLEGAYHGLHAAWLSIEVPFYIIADTKHTSNSTVLSFCNAHDHIGEERSLVRSTPLDERMSNLLPDGPILPILNVSTRSLRAYQRALRAFFAASILRGRCSALTVLGEGAGGRRRLRRWTGFHVHGAQTSRPDIPLA